MNTSGILQSVDTLMGADERPAAEVMSSVEGMSSKSQTESAQSDGNVGTGSANSSVAPSGYQFKKASAIRGKKMMSRWQINQWGCSFYADVCTSSQQRESWEVLSLTPIDRPLCIV
jgi:hypothetical protein